MARLIPLVIGLLANLIGLGGLSKKVMKIFKKIRKRVDKAVNKLLAKAKKAARKILRKLGIGKKGDKKKKETDADIKDSGGIAAESFKMAGSGHTLSFKKGKVHMASNNPGELGQKLAAAKKEAEANPDAENFKGKGEHVIKSLGGLQNALSSRESNLTAASSSNDDKKIKKAQKSFKELASNIGDFGTKYELKDLKNITEGGDQLATGTNQKKYGLLLSTSISNRNGTLEGTGTKLGKNLADDFPIGTRSDYQAHHIIATSSAKKSGIMKAAAETGYDINRTQNGVYLPNTLDLAEQVGRPAHTGKHMGKYFNTVVMSLKAIEDAAINAKSKNKPWTEEKLISEVGKAESNLRGRLMDMQDPMKLQHEDKLKPMDPDPTKKTF